MAFIRSWYTQSINLLWESLCCYFYSPLHIWAPIIVTTHVLITKTIFAFISVREPFCLLCLSFFWFLSTADAPKVNVWLLWVGTVSQHPLCNYTSTKHTTVYNNKDINDLLNRQAALPHLHTKTLVLHQKGELRHCGGRFRESWILS